VIKPLACLVVLYPKHGGEVIQRFRSIDEGDGAATGDGVHHEVPKNGSGNRLGKIGTRILNRTAAECLRTNSRILDVNDGFAIHVQHQIEASHAGAGIVLGTAIGHEFSLLDKDRWKCACATRLHYHEPAVFECRDLALLRPVSSRHQLGRGFPRIELDALDAVGWITGVFPIISSDFKSMIPIFCNRRFNFLAGAKLNRICAANECGGQN